MRGRRRARRIDVVNGIIRHDGDRDIVFDSGIAAEQPRRRATTAGATTTGATTTRTATRRRTSARKLVGRTGFAFASQRPRFGEPEIYADRARTPPVVSGDDWLACSGTEIEAAVLSRVEKAATAARRSRDICE